MQCTWGVTAPRTDTTNGLHPDVVLFRCTSLLSITNFASCRGRKQKKETRERVRLNLSNQAFVTAAAQCRNVWELLLTSPAYALVRPLPTPVHLTASTRPGMTVGENGDPESTRSSQQANLIIGCELFFTDAGEHIPAICDPCKLTRMW